MANRPGNGKQAAKNGAVQRAAAQAPAPRKRAKTVYTEEDVDHDYERSVKFANRGCLIAFAALMLIVAAVMLWAFLFIKGEIDGTSAPATVAKTIDIPSGAGGQTIASVLGENGLIGNETAFRIYVRVNGAASQFRSGRYTIEPNTSYDDIIEMLTQEPPPRETINLTFKEGDTVWKYGTVCEEAGICTVQEFLDAANDVEAFADIKFFQYIDFDPDTWMKAEGYMAPNTYQFYTDETPHNVARKLYEQFNTELDNMKFYTADGEMTFYQMLDKQGLSFREAITLASMVEEEAGLAENQGEVASVFYNRLKREDIDTNELPRRTLGSDVTVYYVRDWIARDYGGDVDAVPENLSYAYIALDTPESREKLPVGPLSNPSITAIKASLQPVQTDYFYFVTDKAGTYYYAKTYREHQNNIAKADAVNQQIGDTQEGES